MEELTAIKTADGREFKPWASVDDVAAIRTDVQEMATSVSESVSNIESALTGVMDDYAEQLQEIIGIY